MSLFKFTKDDINRGKLVNPGEWYPSEIISYERATAKDGSGLDKFKARIIDGEFEGVPLYFQFSEKAPGFAIPFAEAILEQKVEEDTEFELSHALVGRKIDIYVTRSLYNGKEQNNVANFRPLSA